MALKKSGKKADLIDRLREARVTYKKLGKENLQKILAASGLPVSGNIPDLVARLPAPRAVSDAGAGSANPVAKLPSPSRVPAGWETALAAAEHLDTLTNDDLSGVCESMALKKSGKKADLIDRLREEGVTYKKLGKEILQKILAASGLPVSGNIPDLVARLPAPRAVSGAGAGSASAGASAMPSPGPAVGEKRSRAVMEAEADPSHVSTSPT
jgi:hypothetical protein